MNLLPAQTLSGVDRIHHGNALSVLRRLPSASVQTIVTSPPYFGLRDYGVDGQIGLEQTPQEYVAALVAVFHEARRVLRDDGTLWLNLGDSYASSTGNKTITPQTAYLTGRAGGGAFAPAKKTLEYAETSAGYKAYDVAPKNLLGIPWRTAFALQDDGWILRSDIIWAKPNPMPESVTDRPTKAHEYVFLFAKSPRYYYDADAVRESAETNVKSKILGRGNQGYARASGATKNPQRDQAGGYGYVSEGKRNRRTVWNVATHPFKGAHFATFPPKLIEPCILAGAPVGGVVLDPFFGSGTTGAVAIQHGRHYVGIELNAGYIEIANGRLAAARVQASKPKQLAFAGAA